ncbi:hypothetical protein ACE1OC_00590 [Streptomyces sp. DSM 116496]|uniref:hypothetical protein n=1 Tax=Streptomyces stoeckheimensis TaxID=3344656 RepID=UPI0038B32E63
MIDRSSDTRLKRINVWQGENCHLYARAWSVCKNDSSRICSWGNRLSGATATDHADTGRAVVVQYFAIAVADDGVGLVVPLDERTPRG